VLKAQPDKQTRNSVAITRAKALLIVVGDPFVLALDPLWKSFINFIHVRGGYKGIPIDWDPNEPVDRNAPIDEQRRAQGRGELDELIARTKSEILSQTENLGNEESAEVYIERPWRDDE
jgi:helicase MOV-10